MLEGVAGKDKPVRGRQARRQELAMELEDMYREGFSQSIKTIIVTMSIAK